MVLEKVLIKEKCFKVLFKKVIYLYSFTYFEIFPETFFFFFKEYKLYKHKVENWEEFFFHLIQ